MNKKELVSQMAQKSGLTQKDTEKALDTFIEVVSASLEQGQSVQLIGFGTFEVRQRAARDGKNPRTGETIHMPAAKVPAFKAGKALKEKVNP